MVIGGGRGRIEWANVFDYRPQRSCGKVMFLHLSVILFTGGVSAPVHAGIHIPLGRHPPGRHPPPAQCMLGYTPPPPAQCILGYTSPCPVHAGIHPLPSACWDIHGYCCGQYAPYWNAFLFKCVFLHGWSSGHLSIRIVYKSTVNINTYDSELCLKCY